MFLRVIFWLENMLSVNHRRWSTKIRQRLDQICERKSSVEHSQNEFRRFDSFLDIIYNFWGIWCTIFEMRSLLFTFNKLNFQFWNIASRKTSFRKHEKKVSYKNFKRPLLCSNSFLFIFLGIDTINEQGWPVQLFSNQSGQEAETFGLSYSKV